MAAHIKINTIILEIEKDRDVLRVVILLHLLFEISSNHMLGFSPPL